MHLLSEKEGSLQTEASAQQGYLLCFEQDRGKAAIKAKSLCFEGSFPPERILTQEPQNVNPRVGEKIRNTGWPSSLCFLHMTELFLAKM